MLKALLIALAIFVVIMLALPIKPPEDTVPRCIERGIRYFKEIGSYPFLSNGRRADETAEERCEKSLRAF